MDINLKGLLSTIVSEKSITVNLYNNETNLLIITFVKDGYPALEDDLESSEVKKIVIKNTNTLDIYIQTT